MVQIQAIPTPFLWQPPELVVVIAGEGAGEIIAGEGAGESIKPENEE
jgi:hypothetical protein